MTSKKRIERFERFRHNVAIIKHEADVLALVEAAREMRFILKIYHKRHNCDAPDICGNCLSVAQVDAALEPFNRED